MLILFRWPILLGLAFLAGVLMERNAARTACENAGGRLAERLCMGLP